MEDMCLSKIQEVEVIQDEDVDSELQAVTKAICPSQCSRNGDCINGVCQCHQGIFGFLFKL